MSQPESAVEQQEEQTVPFYPVQFMREARMAAVMVGIFLVVGALWRVVGHPIGDPADPMVTPQHIKPEWYFLAIYQLLKFVPKTVGAVIPIVVVGLLFALPFIDRRQETDRRPARVRLIATVLVTVVVVAMTIWGGK
jgi:quinol-cytochrome oxidoreductase complex cytochrome b subunit